MMRVAFAAAMMLVLLSAASADDSPALLLVDDSRLQAKLDIELNCEPLSLFTEKIQEATGAKIRVQRDIADQNLTAFAKGTSAAQAMENAARVFSYKWEVRGDVPEKRSYLLSRPQKRIVEAEETRQAEWRKADRQFKDGIENGIKMVDADTSAWQKAFDKNPAQAVEDYWFKGAFRWLGCFTKDQRDDFWRRIAASPEGEVQIPFTQLPVSLQKLFKDEAAKDNAEDPDHKPSPDGLNHCGFIIHRDGDLQLHPRIIFIGVEDYDWYMGWSITEKDGRMWDRERQKLKSAGVDISSYKPPTMDYSAEQSKSKRNTIKFKDDKRKETRFHTFADVLEAASRTFDAAIFADDYLSRFSNNLSRRTSFPDNPEEALEEIGREFRYEPTAGGKVVRLRSKTWYVDELYEVPKRLMLRWMEAKKKQGRLELKDYTEIASTLTDLQIDGLSWAYIGRDMPLEFEVGQMGESIENLRLCAILNADQLKTAMADGLPFTAMNLSQQQRFADLLRAARPDLSDDALARCTFRVSEDIKEDWSHEANPVRLETDYFNFTYTFAPGDQVVSSGIYLDAKPLDEETPKEEREEK